MNENDFLPPTDLISPEEIAEKALTIRDAEQFSALVSQFNNELRKKDLVRLAKFSDIQDEIVKQLQKRMVQNADAFSNKDLITYLTAVQNILDKNQQAAANIPQIAIQQNVVNVGMDGVPKMSKESRDKVKEAVDFILNQQLSQIDTTNNTQEIIDSDDE